MIPIKYTEKKLPAKLPRGFRDCNAELTRNRHKMLQTISKVYELYGFDPLETPSIEFVESLGKYLPDVDRPMGGIFGFQDDDEQWIALRYDLTAPLARMAAMNHQNLPRPFRRYQYGLVYRNEKPGPGRFREFYQCDADIVGSPIVTADAELIMMVSDALIELGLAESDFKIKINNRKILTAVLELAGLNDDHSEQKNIALRAIDKLDRLGIEGVKLLLTTGRKDESGDFTKGANLSNEQASTILKFVEAGGKNNIETIANLKNLVQQNAIGLEGVSELEEIADITSKNNYNDNIICLDPSTVRGLGYYTGPVFEAELTFGIPNEKGEIVQFGSVAGGGRYDDLVKRFTGQDLPATGISIGVDRLLTALMNKNLLKSQLETAPIVVLPMDKEQMPRYYAMVTQLRKAGLRAELYLGGAGMKAQLKYADKRNAPIAIIEGENEREKGIVILKDLDLGSRLAENINDNETWRKGQPAQEEIAFDNLVDSVKIMLQRIKERK